LRSGVRRDDSLNGGDVVEGEELGESTKGIGLGEENFCSVDISRCSANGATINFLHN
jgi:hypothetical protein